MKRANTFLSLWLRAAARIPMLFRGGIRRKRLRASAPDCLLSRKPSLQAERFPLSRNTPQPANALRKLLCGENAPNRAKDRLGLPMAVFCRENRHCGIWHGHFDNVKKTAPAHKRRSSFVCRKNPDRRVFAMQKHRRIRNVPVPRPCGATGHDARNLHALSFVQVRGALFMHEALWRMRRYIEIPALSIAHAFSSSRMNMMKKLTASSAQETQMPCSAMCADNSAPSPAPMANRPMTPK